MNKEYYQKLTLAVYKVTEFFPEKEPLKFQIREMADRILANLALANPHPENIGNKGDLIRDIKILDSYFELASIQNWVDPRNFTVLKGEYGKLQKLAEDALNLDELSQPVPPKAVLSNSGKVAENPLPNNHRQQRILEAVSGNGMVKIGDLIKLMPEVNRRTVLRDLDKLCQSGSVARNGNGRGIYYTKNGHKHDMS